jgi:hypothetical protein
MSNANNSNPVFATSFLLLAQYGGRAVIPIELVRRDYFPHLTVDSLLRKTTSGGWHCRSCALRNSQKAAKGVHLSDLALYIDARVAAARKECQQLTGKQFPG